MAKRVYRTSQGKSIDLGALQLQNETVRAVGNMGVNARGDVINPQNNTIETKNQSVNRQYKKQVRTNVTDEMPPVSKSKKQKQEVQTPVVEKVKEVNNVQVTPEPVTEVEIAEVPELEVEASPAPAPKEKSTPVLGGLAGAIAKAKQVKQEPLKTPRQLRQEQSGVKKI